MRAPTFQLHGKACSLERGGGEAAHKTADLDHKGLVAVEDSKFGCPKKTQR